MDTHAVESREEPTPSSSNAQMAPHTDGGHKKKRTRGGKKRRNRRQSFAAPTEAGPSHEQDRMASSQNLLGNPAVGQSGLYDFPRKRRNLSDASLDSQALLDHREQPPMLARRQSGTGQNSFGPPANQPVRPGLGRPHEGSQGYRSRVSDPFIDVSERSHHRSRALRTHHETGRESSEEDEAADDRTPLMTSSQRQRLQSSQLSDARGRVEGARTKYGSRNHPSSAESSRSSRRKQRTTSSQRPSSGPQVDYDVNNPPSMPASPQLGADLAYNDVMLPKDYALSPPNRVKLPHGGETLIDIDEAPPPGPYDLTSSLQTPRGVPIDHRRRTLVVPAEKDVCFPVEGLSEIADEDAPTLHEGQYRSGHRRRRTSVWPDFSVLEEWSIGEKEDRSEGIRAKKISEPMLVGGRLRPNNRGWHRMEEDAPYRFTYFNEELPSTIHSQTISELLQPGQTFKELFIPDPPELSDDESGDEEDQMSSHGTSYDHQSGESKTVTRQSSTISRDKTDSRNTSGEATPSQNQSQNQTSKPKIKRYGPRPVFWLDVLSPTDAEMKVISKTFGIHPLTAEDIFMQEAREKVELFRNYYFVNYRTFEQDVSSEDYLDPVNMYVVVFREGVISFHFSMVPHPANVRRRIRQLKDYLILSSDWISYAIIDDITDVFAPLSQSLEDEVDDIEDAILRLHSSRHDASNASKSTSNKDPEKSEAGDGTTGDSGGDMLRRVGDCRKKVMGLYRLLGNKADVIKGFAKRCNEHWEVAPRSEIGLYLGDIQDHIITMTSNLSHYESILSRSHSNYLAQINIRMNERQEQTADVLGRLTVLGTIVLPMNIITGLWGMNCLVPGQGADDLTWFWSISASLLVFGFLCYFTAKRVYGIV